MIPEFLERAEVAHRGLTELHVVGSMHARKALMAELADGFIALPGGFGTLDELAEALTWTQLGLQAKPVVLLDVDGFWEPLVRFVDAAVDHGFVRPAHRMLLPADGHRRRGDRAGDQPGAQHPAQVVGPRRRPIGPRRQVGPGPQDSGRRRR